MSHIEFGDESQRMQLLSTLPKLISESQNDADFAARLVKLLLQAIEKAEAVAVMAYDDWQGELNEPKLTRWDSRSDIGRFRPSRRLIGEALRSKKSVVHFWNESSEITYKVTSGLDWAFCTPLTAASSVGWCLYVSGKSDFGVVNEESLLGDLKFTELLAQFLGAVRPGAQSRAPAGRVKPVLLARRYRDLECSLC